MRTTPQEMEVGGCKDCLLRPGNTNCGGCGMSIALTMMDRVIKELGEKVSMVIPACCGIVTAGGYPTSAYGVPVVASTFASAAAVAAGIAAINDMNGSGEKVIAWAGDGGTFDIGMATLSAAAERNDNVLYICYDNEIYGNTGGQRSSATPTGAKTTTTPFGKSNNKKDIVSILAAHKVPYAATLSIAHIDDFNRKIKTALQMKGFRFLLVHAPCPTGWKSEPGQTVQLVRLAVNNGLFPLYEVYDGERYRINYSLPEKFTAEQYFYSQRRFPKNSINLDAVIAQSKATYERLSKMAELWPARDDE